MSSERKIHGIAEINNVELVPSFKEGGFEEKGLDYLLDSLSFPATLISILVALRILQYKVEAYFERRDAIRANIRREAQISALKREINEFTKQKEDEIGKI